jgi:hypothetical protein
MKLTKLLLLGIAVVFLSCGDDDDPQPTAEALVGSWAITALDYEGTTTTTANGMTISADFEGVGKDMNLVTVFGSNPNTVSNSGSFTIELTTTLAGQSFTEEHMFNEVVSEGTWTLSGKTLTITTPDGPQEATIVEQTATSLKMKVEVTETQSASGMTVKVDVVGNYTFQKQ